LFICFADIEYHWLNYAEEVAPNGSRKIFLPKIRLMERREEERA